MSEIAQVLLPSGDLIWVRLQGAELAVAGERAAGAVDVGLVERITPVVVRLPGFTETVRGVVTSVREALDEYRPDSLAVEFGIEITARTGAVLSVLAEAGGTAQVKITASWDRHGTPVPPSAKEEAGPA